MPGGNKGEGNLANGLYHFGQRYYDPTTGRWTQQDPLNQIGRTTRDDRYPYAGDDPTNLSDPSGLCFVFSCKEYHEIEETITSPGPENDLIDREEGYSPVQQELAADADDWGFDDIEFDWP